MFTNGGHRVVNTYKFLERKKKLENGLREALIMVFLIIKKKYILKHEEEAEELISLIILKL